MKAYQKQWLDTIINGDRMFLDDVMSAIISDDTGCTDELSQALAQVVLDNYSHIEHLEASDAIYNASIAKSDENGLVFVNKTDLDRLQEVELKYETLKAERDS